jgi:hypothetical protein
MMRSKQPHKRDARMHVRFLILIFLLAILATGCTKDCTPGNYLFVLPHTVSPAQTVYKVGDTISVSADFSHFVLDIARNEPFLLEDFSFELSFYLSDLQDSVPERGLLAFSTCEILLEENTNLFLDNIGPLGEYTYRDGRYRLGFKFRPLKPGFYALVQQSYMGSEANSTIQKEFPGICKPRSRPNIASFVEVNNGAENNYHLLQNEHYEGATHPWRVNEMNFQRGGVFLFYVEE